MCLNCGCGKPDDQHGDAANITRDQLERAAKANDMDLRQSVENMQKAVSQLQGSSRETASAGMGSNRPA